jgi:hypothetical protein
MPPYSQLKTDEVRESILRLGAAFSSEMLVIIHQTKRGRISECNNLQCHHCENFKSSYYRYV